ncbi:MAG: VTT domain-containing protein [Caldimicrobium sp.]
MEKKLQEFLEKCSNCGICQIVCPFLEKYGLPSEIIRKKSVDVYYCTNCGACTLICKEKASPFEALYTLKMYLVKEKNPLVDTILKNAYSFVKRGQSFPFSHWEKSEIIFWPGCSLSGTSPNLVLHLHKHLENKYGKKGVGLVLDCCFDPLYQNGDLETVEKAWMDFNKKFAFYQIKKVITGCTNCFKIFKAYGKNLEISHILQEFHKEDFQNVPDDAFLHIPCPAFKEKEIQELVLNNFKERVKDFLRIPACCGAGGSAHLDEKLSKAFLEKNLQKSQNGPILTFCMGCKNRFLKAGANAFHLLETIPKVKPFSKPLSSFQKWKNRFFLSLKRKILKFNTILILSLFFLFFLGIYFQKQGIFQEKFLKDFLEPYARHPLSMLLYLGIYAIAPSLFISSLGLTLAAGFLWGPLKGTLLALSGATLGATVSFLLSRYIFRDFIKYRLGFDKWQYLEKLTKTHGWKALAFARLVPFFPYPVINYLFGLLPLSLKTYIIVTFLFMAPAGFAYTYLGFSIKEIFLKGNFFPIFLVIGIFLLLTFLIKFLRKKWNFQKP